MVKGDDIIVTGVAIALIVLSIMNIAGLVFLTQFAFQGKQTDDDNNTVEVTNFSKNKLVYSKVTIVLLWLQITLSVLASVSVSSK